MVNRPRPRLCRGIGRAASLLSFPRRESPERKANARPAKFWLARSRELLWWRSSRRRHATLLLCRDSVLQVAQSSARIDPAAPARDRARLVCQRQCRPRFRYRARRAPQKTQRGALSGPGNADSRTAMRQTPGRAGWVRRTPGICRECARKSGTVSRCGAVSISLPPELLE